MTNFKEIAEKCLAGELSGRFVLRNGKVFHSKIHLSATSFYALPYCIAGWNYSVVGNCYSKSLSVRDNDVIAFISDMKKEQIKIDIPEGKVPVMEQTENGVVITWKEKELTYDDIVIEQAKAKTHITIFSYNMLATNPEIHSFYKKVEVLRKLTNIRNYFGKPDNMSEGWCIAYSKHYNTFTANYINNADEWFSGILFKEGEHAEQAIKILGDELKYLFEPW